VVLAVPSAALSLRGRAQVAFLSRYAREALERSAQASGLTLGRLRKDAQGAPLPAAGNYWSVTHKPRYVGGVAAPLPIGIDIEKIRPCAEALFRKTADSREWGLGAGDREVLFFRYWTAKEAVLKAAGTGLRGLGGCRIRTVDDPFNLTLDCEGRTWQVEHLYFGGHIASVVKHTGPVVWLGPATTGPVSPAPS
jgi:4'-phosphopantetheinyl transferase